MSPIKIGDRVMVLGSRLFGWVESVHDERTGVWVRIVLDDGGTGMFKRGRLVQLPDLKEVEPGGQAAGRDEKPEVYQLFGDARIGTSSVLS